MPNIRCAACGKHYDYHREGCCPRCGAYNRPPRREWVEADGSVHHGTPSKKVCYEKKVCFEEQARKPRKKPSAPQAATAAPKPSQIRYSRGKARNNSLAFVIIAIVFLLIFALAKGGLLNKTIWDHEFREDNDWSDNDWDDSDWPDIDWDDSDWDPKSTTPAVHYRDIDADCGDIIDISDDLALQILGYVSGDNGQVYVLYWASDSDLAKALLESGSLLLWSDTGGFACPPDEIADSYIYFNTYSPDTRWQTLTISDCTAGNITIRSLLPHEGVDIPDYNLPTTAYPA